MTRKILIVGNSHVAAIRKGWGAISERFSDFDVEFFAANSTLFNSMVLNEDLVFGIHEEANYKVRFAKFLRENFGKIKVELAEKDAVLLIGKSTNEVDFLKNLTGFSIDGVREIGPGPRVSTSAFNSFANAIYDKRQLGPEWTHWDKPRLFVLPAPAPSEGCPDGIPRYDAWAKFAQQNIDNLTFLEHYRKIVRDRLAADGVSVLSPPDSVLASTGLTLSKYSAQAEKLPFSALPRGGKYGEDDYHHMDGDYGAIVLEHVLQAVRSDLDK